MAAEKRRIWIDFSWNGPRYYSTSITCAQCGRQRGGGYSYPREWLCEACHDARENERKAALRLMLQGGRSDKDGNNE